MCYALKKIKIKYLNTLRNKKPKFRAFQFNSENLSCGFSNEIPENVSSEKKWIIIICILGVFDNCF